MDTLQRLFEDYFAESVIVTVLVAVGLVVLVIWLTKTWEKVKRISCDEHAKRLNDVESTVSKIDDLPCDNHHSKIDNLIALTNRIDGNLSALTAFIKPERSVFQTKSPITVSDYGNRISTELGLDGYINKNWDFIIRYVDEKSESKNPYDIQQICFNLAMSEPEKVLSDDGFDALKRKAYNEGVLLHSFQQLVGILVRERYFKERNINVWEVDKHDPNKQDDSPQ